MTQNSDSTVIPSGSLISVKNASEEVIGYGYGDGTSPQTAYWCLPPTEDRPPDAGVTFYYSVETENVTYASFIQTVRGSWNANSRMLTSTCTSYTDYDSIPEEYRTSFFPNAGSGGGGGMPMEVDHGTTGIYAPGGGNVGVAYRTDTADSYNEYWVLSSSYDYTQTLELTAGTINAGFNTWRDGMTCVLIQTSETATEPNSV